MSRQKIQAALKIARAKYIEVYRADYTQARALHLRYWGERCLEIRKKINHEK